MTLLWSDNILVKLQFSFIF